MLQTDDDEKWLIDNDSAHTEGTQDGERWADSVSGLFHKACTGEPGSEVQQAAQDELRRIHSTLSAESAETAMRLADRIANGGVRTRLMPALWDASEGPQRLAAGAERDSLWQPVE
eukprot:TRINITY_DN11635_c0_g2_i1.p3 TRINITY_DN11635_c0_g2~~TRINITY_DN11635_c0_g2_i1.p3  ORF type:complete len:116 (+),score=25.07 TRINITY_DN11635_c0_g2_i1:296-643(+)